MLALLQHPCPPDLAPADQLERACRRIREAARQGARIVVTPELFTTPYFPRTQDEAHFDLAEPIPGPTTEHLAGLASELDIHIAASIFERRAPGLYHNSFLVIAPNHGLICHYRKIHIPHDPGYHEKYYFTPGDLGFQVAHTPHAKLGLLVCWDQWFPEAARATALLGAHVLLYPTAIGWVDGEPAQEQQQQRDAWLLMHQAHAVANGVYVAAVNRVGREGALNFWGGSCLIDPAGRVVAEAPPDREHILLAELDHQAIETQRRGWPFLRDRRPETYTPLTTLHT